MKKYGRIPAIAFAAAMAALALVSCRDGKKAAKDPAELQEEETKVEATSYAAEGAQSDTGDNAAQGQSGAISIPTTQGWSENELQVIERITKNMKRERHYRQPVTSEVEEAKKNMTSQNSELVTVGRQPGTYEFCYYVQGRERHILAPVGFFEEVDEHLYDEKYNFLIRGDSRYWADSSSTNDIMAMAFKRKDKDDILTVLFSTTQWQNWNTCNIDVSDACSPESEFTFPSFDLHCVNATVG